MEDKIMRSSGGGGGGGGGGGCTAGGSCCCSHHNYNDDDNDNKGNKHGNARMIVDDEPLSTSVISNPPSRMMEMPTIQLLYRGKTYPLFEEEEDGNGGCSSTGLTPSTACRELYRTVSQRLRQLGLIEGDENPMNDDTNSVANHMKLVWKGKKLDHTSQEPISEVFALEKNKSNNKNTNTKSNILKLMVIATSTNTVQEIVNKKSDPTIRGFEQETKREHARKVASQQAHEYWGPTHSKQDPNYKFCRYEPCTWQSFGHRPSSDATPHDYEALRLLRQLATDPGIVAIMKERELVVGILGEMDPIDDRVMLKKQDESNGKSCLLGYNTNGGYRIDIKLRHDDLSQGFRPYSQLVQTLIHELSHNWVGPHNLLFWTNYGHMRIEYLYTHYVKLRTYYVNGRTTADLAGLSTRTNHVKRNTTTTTTTTDTAFVLDMVLDELVSEMGQHGLHPRMIESSLRERYQQLEQQHISMSKQQYRVGTSSSGGESNSGNGNQDPVQMSARERALAAAEERLRRQQNQNQNSKQNSNNNNSPKHK